MAMRKDFEGYEGWLTICGRQITNLQYADDIVLLASSEKNSEDNEQLVSAGMEYGLMH